MVVSSSVNVNGLVEKKKGFDVTVGGLVWVQRKNGSWWPGQIVGTEELCETDMVTPRSGTPIKLLGRDDTSVDWFDLETTKVVKPFRCGEYEDCIQKAEIAAAKNSLKFTKYPRRENAIVCALELEKENLFKDYPKGDTRLNDEKGSTSISRSGKDGESSSAETSSGEILGACEDNTNSTQELSRSGISFEGTNGVTHIKGQQLKGRKRKTPNDSEDDGYEGAKRMKGLNDLGTVPEKADEVLALPNLKSECSESFNNLPGANGLSVGTLTNGNVMPTAKRKRSQVVHIHELLKRKFQPRPAAKVLENTSMVPVPIICDEFANPFERYDAVSPYYDCEDGNKVKDAELYNGLFPEDDPSEMLFDVPFVDEIQPSGLSPPWQSASRKPHFDSFRGHLSPNIKVQTSSCDHDAVDESAPTYSAGPVNQHFEKSASKWQSKGKRNARHTSKAEDPYSIKKGDLHENYGRLSPGSNGLVNGFSECRNHISLSSSQRSFTFNQSRFSPHSNPEMADDSPRSIPTDSLLYEVEVTVEATRLQVQHVPYISLRSKLNGKPITGHPVPVKVLKDGYSDLQTSDYPASDSCELEDEDTEMDLIIKPVALPKKKTKLRSRNRHRRSKSRKRHGSSSKKTRKLSTLTGAQKLSLVKNKMASQTPKGPMLACVPLKVVFSRINEALNGSRSAHRASNSCCKSPA